MPPRTARVIFTMCTQLHQKDLDKLKGKMNATNEDKGVKRAYKKLAGQYKKLIKDAKETRESAQETRSQGYCRPMPIALRYSLNRAQVDGETACYPL